MAHFSSCDMGLGVFIIVLYTFYEYFQKSMVLSFISLFFYIGSIKCHKSLQKGITKY